MNIMKRAALISVVLFLGSLAIFAEPASPRRFSNALLDDVVQMTRAGLSDATIVAYVNARRSRLDQDVTAEDLVQLQRAGVREKVVRAIAGAAGFDAGPANRSEEMTYNSEDEAAASAEPSGAEDEAYNTPGYGYPDAYGYPYWYAYSPYWYAYSPYFSGTFFFGGRFGSRFHGRGFVPRSVGRGGFRGRVGGGRGRR